MFFDSKKYFFLNVRDKNFEDLIIDSILFPRTFIKIVNNSEEYEVMKHNYQIEDDYNIDLLYYFIMKYKKNIFNYLYNINYLENKFKSFDLPDDIKDLTIKVIKNKIEEDEIDKEEILKNILIAAENEILQSFFENELVELLYFVLSKMKKSDFSKNAEKHLERIFSKLKNNEKFDIIRLKYNRLKTCSQ